MNTKATRSTLLWSLLSLELELSKCASDEEVRRCQPERAVRRRARRQRRIARESGKVEVTSYDRVMGWAQASYSAVYLELKRPSSGFWFARRLAAAKPQCIARGSVLAWPG